ncbi:MAG: hypothetical protein A2Y41_09555 [Spirochaetes bacterium GWB1_36_13]|nr:MAG: hypothetical protein A2Y41_09555 [Spirochaetes bacterium GWB1_36_13]
MKKFLLFLFLTLFIVSCGGGEAVKPEKETPQTQEPKKEEVKKEEPKKEEIAKVEPKKEEPKKEEIPVFNTAKFFQDNAFKIIVSGFKTNQSRIESAGMKSINDAAKKIDILSEMLKKSGFSGKITLYIDGHTDQIGSEQRNDALSLERAENVIETLKTKIKDTSFFEFQSNGLGYKELLLKASPKNEKNRRVEIYIKK